MQKSYEVGIILGHVYMGFGEYTSRQRKRMEKGRTLLRSGQVQRLMTTGGKGMWRKTTPSMAEVAWDYLQAQGVDAASILVEPESTTTHQNAEQALRMMQELNLISLLVITSADHMPRARALFSEIFPDHFDLAFEISDSFCRIWSLVDFFWNRAGDTPLGLKPRGFSFQRER